MTTLQIGRRMKLLLGGLLALLAIDLAAYLYLDHLRGPDDRTTPPSVQIGGPFSLIDQDGHAVTDRDYRDKWLLVYFGFTHCPDACPTALNTIAEAMSQLGPDASKVRPFLITVDPERDTPMVLKEYVSVFGERITGLTGTTEQIEAIAHSYRVYYAKHAVGGDGDYTMDHSSVIYLMGPAGQFAANFSTDSAPETMVGKIRALLAETRR